MGDNYRNTEPDWRDELQVGDVVYEGGNPKKPRIVRKVTYRKSNPSKVRLHGITLSILRCSWTGRAYTVINRTDLKTRAFTKAPWRVTKMTLMDKRLNACIQDYNNRSLGCCDVRGMR